MLRKSCAFPDFSMNVFLLSSRRSILAVAALVAMVAAAPDLRAQEPGPAETGITRVPVGAPEPPPPKPTVSAKGDVPASPPAALTTPLSGAAAPALSTTGTAPKPAQAPADRNST